MEEKVLNIMSEGGAMRPGEIAEAAGIDKEDASKIIKKLVAEGKVFSPKRCFYEISK